MGQQHAILIIDMSIRVVHASPGAALMFGFDSSEQMVGTDGFALVAPDEDERARQVVVENLGKAIAGTRGPWRMARKDGSTFIVEIEATYLREPGRDHRILLSLLDTTEQRRTSRALAQALEWTDHLLDLAGTIIVELDHQGRVSRVNAEGARILGHPREWILGKDWFEHFVPQRMRDQVRWVAGQIMSGELEAVKFYENPVLTASGEERIIYWHNSFTRDGQGRISHILSSGLDITERVAAEHRHRTIFERAANPIARLALDGTIIDCNPQVERVFGYPVDEIRGENARRLIHPDDHERITVDLGDIRTLETYYQRHYCALHKDGHAIDIEVDASLGLGSGGEQEIIILVADVSVRRRSERMERLSHRLLRIFHQHRRLDGLAKAFCEEVCESTGCAAVAVRRRLSDGSAPWVANLGFPKEIAAPLGGLAEGETGGFATMVTVPIRFGERDLGLIHAASIEPRGIPRDVLSVLDESALQLGIAMQRIQAERKLQEQLAFQQEVLEAIPIPVYYKDAQGRMIGWNRAWVRATGWRPSEVQGRKAEQVLPEDEAAKFVQYDAELLARPGRQVFEHSFTSPSGQIRDTVIHRATFSRGGQQVGGIIGAMVDVTALKQATTALEDLNRNLELRVQERIGELQTLYRLSRELVHTNNLSELGRATLHHLHAALPADVTALAVCTGERCELFLRSDRPLTDPVRIELQQRLAAELTRLGMSWPPTLDLPHEGSAADAQPPLRQLGSTYTVPLQAEGRARYLGVLISAAEAEECFTENHARLLHVASSQIAETAHRLQAPAASPIRPPSSVGDVGDAGEGAELSEVRQLLDRLPQLAFLIDADHRLVHINITATDQLDLHNELMRGSPIALCPIPWEWERLEPALLPLALQSGPTRLSDLRYTHPSGRMGILDLWLLPLDDGRGRHRVLLLAEDVTQRRDLEARLMLARKMESIGQLASGIAHEINTPTQYVGDNLQFLGESFEDMKPLLEGVGDLLGSPALTALPSATRVSLAEAYGQADLDYLLEEIPNAVQQAREGVVRISSIVGAMREFSHGGVREKTVVDINRSVRSTVTVARNEWKYVSTVDLELDPELPPIPTLGAELNQVLLNLLINSAHAIAATGRDERAELGSITIRTSRLAEGIVIEVEDDGCGIPYDLQHRVFEPFFTTKPVGQGTGQGLSISHTIVVDKLGGSLGFDSTPGRGSIFTIRLPF